jgi:tetratricopeptide (TPR) repeat protein
MKWSIPAVLVLSLLAFVMNSVSADEVLLNGGDAIDGKITAVDEKGVLVEADGKSVLVSPDRLDPHFYYTEWAKRVPNEAKPRLLLAVYAFENALFSQARSQYRKAQKLDKEVVKDFEENVVPKIKEGAARKLMDRARRAAKEKNWHDVERIAAKILTQLEDTEAAEEARKLIASAHINQMDDDEKRLVKRLARYLPKDEAKALAEREKLGARLAPIERRLDRARRRVVQGLQTKSQNRSKGVFKDAGRQFERVIKDLNKLEESAGDEEAFKAQVDEMRSVAKREGIEAYIHAGNVYLVRGAFNDATAMANRCLAIDPESDVAQQFGRRVAHSAQMRSGWWGRGRRR